MSFQSIITEVYTTYGTYNQSRLLLTGIIIAKSGARIEIVDPHRSGKVVIAVKCYKRSDKPSGKCTSF